MNERIFSLLYSVHIFTLTTLAWARSREGKHLHDEVQDLEDHFNADKVNDDALEPVTLLLTLVPLQQPQQLHAVVQLGAHHLHGRYSVVGKQGKSSEYRAL